MLGAHPKLMSDFGPSHFPFQTGPGPRLCWASAGRRMSVMTINLSGQLEHRLRDLASQQGRDLRAVVEDALRRYLEDAAITDLTPAEVAATQEELLGELNVTPWTPEPADDETQ